MRPILTADEMRAADAWTIVHGTPGTTLMENAGLAVARAIESRFGKERRVAIVCGLGQQRRRRLRGRACAQVGLDAGLRDRRSRRRSRATRAITTTDFARSARGCR